MGLKLDLVIQILKFTNKNYPEIEVNILQKMSSITVVLEKWPQCNKFL